MPSKLSDGFHQCTVKENHVIKKLLYEKHVYGKSLEVICCSIEKKKNSIKLQHIRSSYQKKINTGFVMLARLACFISFYYL